MEHTHHDDASESGEPGARKVFILTMAFVVVFVAATAAVMMM